MKKEYNLPEKDQEENGIQEPAVNYTQYPFLEKSPGALKAPCQYSVEELRERVLAATKEIEEGKYYTENELDDFIFS